MDLRNPNAAAGLFTVTLFSTTDFGKPSHPYGDEASPRIRWASAVPRRDAEAVRERFRGLVEQRRDANGVRELDVGREAI